MMEGVLDGRGLLLLCVDGGVQTAAQFGHEQRLAAEGCDAGLQGLVLDVRPVVCRQDDDGHVFSHFLSDPSGDFDAVQIRKQQIDDIDGVSVAPHGCLAGAQHGFLSGHGPLGAHADLLEHVGYAVAGVEVVIHHQGPAVFQLRNVLHFLFDILEPEGEGYQEFRAHALLAFHPDGAVHHVHDVLRDRHPKPGSLDLADGGVALPLKGLEDAPHEFLAHADASILDGELEVRVSSGRQGRLSNPHGDQAARAGIFDGIAQEVQQHLVQPQLVAVDFLMNHVHGIDIEFQLLCPDVRLDDIAEPMQDVGQAAFLLVQVHLAALYPAHVQDIVDQAQQMVAGGHDLLQIFLHLLPVVYMGHGQGGEAHDGVHGGADVVGHIGEEDALGLAGPVGLKEGVLQQRLLLHLLAGLLIHAAQAQHHAVAFVPSASPHHLQLIILHFAVLYSAIIRIEQQPLRQSLFHLLQGEEAAQHIPVLLMDELLDIALRALRKYQLPAEDGTEQRGILILDL